MSEFGIALACTIFCASAHAAQPVEILTVSQLNQLDMASSSPVAPRAVKPHRHVHRSVMTEGAKFAVRPDGFHKGGSGDPIAAFAGVVPADGCSAYARHGKADGRFSSVSPGFYRVNSGDTVARIAAAFGQQPKDLMNRNNLASASLIQPGQVLRIGPLPVDRSRGFAR
ncbi:LysM peptidoglycan-binding domain-containing protein [Burkholderia sp. BE17]|uniref:LysM peptidoglycan-binding domain-containing protein n=1 Tax=Burkholderia sp. BE17 TaxID=2656644 RepID=UPI00187B7D76|nr:LysM domain-containing protein [Burkholderia sp. BE17]